MSIHDKMNADYLWVRHAPVQQSSKVRNHGLYFVYDRVPNSIERLEMIYRSIGKQYDWQLEKFRLGKKGVDKGNKKRFLKNFLRFIKHPAGYILWKSMRWNQNIPPKLLTVMFFVGWIAAFYEMTQYSYSVKNHDQLLLIYGKNVEGSQGRMKGYHKRKLMRSPNGFDAFFKTPLSPDQIHLNPTWKQNIRKQLNLTNSHNVIF